MIQIDTKELEKIIHEEVADLNMIENQLTGTRLVKKFKLDNGMPAEIQIVVTRDEDEFFD